MTEHVMNFCTFISNSKYTNISGHIDILFCKKMKVQVDKESDSDTRYG